MLLTDGSPNDTEALRVYESAILDVAKVEMIDLQAKLELAAAEVGEDVLDVLLDNAGSDPKAALRRRLGVSDVVITPQLRRWHAAHTLAVVYRDAFNNQLNDRFQAKCSEYADLAKTAKTHTLRLGIGLALRPVPCPEIPDLDLLDGNAPAGTYYISVSWTTGSGEESAPSEVTTADVPAANTFSVKAVLPPAPASGFNVYVGLSRESMALQNSTPVAVGGSWVMPGGGLVAGPAASDGQQPDVYVVATSLLRRG